VPLIKATRLAARIVIFIKRFLHHAMARHAVSVA
jgi:hypothetical protein